MNSIEHLANLKIIEMYIGYGINAIVIIVLIISLIITLFGKEK